MEKVSKNMKLAAARIAKKATHAGRIVIAYFPGGDPFIAEYSGSGEYTPGAIELFSLPTYPENPESIKSYMEYMNNK